MKDGSLFVFVLTLILVVGGSCLFYLPYWLRNIDSIAKTTLMVERCSGGKVVIVYGHRKFWEVDPKKNQLLKCNN